jgi:3-hydroxyisobutyrate dehydrogenase
VNVTFIGVGAIGLPMALQIKRGGHAVTGVDLSSKACANAQAVGLKAVSAFAQAPAAEAVE